MDQFLFFYIYRQAHTFQKKILPPSFQKGQSGGKMNSTSNLTIPATESLMSNYPVPKLLFNEVLETMDVFSRKHELYTLPSSGMVEADRNDVALQI